METIAATTPSFTAALRLFQAHARLEERFASGLGAVHGLSLKDTLLLMYVAYRGASGRPRRSPAPSVSPRR
jgi:hypothetical protein